ncbi:MAG: hypothetical protein H0Z35_07905 [Thermoanaerobacteraceae bacterium]|nr:hypothetical protein [Thermoanaerobacteraceae bacterium]
MFFGHIAVLAAPGSSAATPGDIGQGNIIEIPTQPDTEVLTYLGILVERYQPSDGTKINSSNNADYTNQVSIDGKNQWFVSKEQCFAGYFELRYDHFDTRKVLFSYAGEAELAGLAHNLLAGNVTFKLRVYHVFRLPDGTDIKSKDFQEIYYRINRPPQLKILSPAANDVFSEVTGYNQLFISGTVKDEDTGDTLTVRYSLGNLSSYQNLLIANLTADGSGQQFQTTILVDDTIPQGNYDLKVSVEDSKGNNTQLTIPVVIDKSPPTITFTPAATNWGNGDVTVGIGAFDSLSSVSEVKYSWSNSSTTPGYWINGSKATQADEGVWFLHVQATDQGGNTLNNVGGPYRIDKTAPSLAGYSLTGAKWVTGDDYWIDGDDTVTISLRSRETLSGMGRTYLRLYNSNDEARAYHDWDLASNQLNVFNSSSLVNITFAQETEELGDYYAVDFGVQARGVDADFDVEWYYTDNAGNNQGYGDTRIDLRVDAELPTVTFTPASCDWSPSITVSVQATDSRSGIAEKYYAVTQSPTVPSTGWQPLDGAVSIAAYGQWYIHVKIKDNVGNELITYSGAYKVIPPLDIVNFEITPNPALSGAEVTFTANTNGYADEARVELWNGDIINLTPSKTPPETHASNTWEATYLTDIDLADGSYEVVLTVGRNGEKPDSAAQTLYLTIDGDIYDQIQPRIKGTN